MLTKLALSIGIILGVFTLWILVQRLARAFAARHPELGPAREEGAGCGFFCFCEGGEECPKEKLLRSMKAKQETLFKPSNTNPHKDRHT